MTTFSQKLLFCMMTALFSVFFSTNSRAEDSANILSQNYLFEKNISKYGPDIQTISSRSFRYLVAVQPHQNAEGQIGFYSQLIIQVAEAKGYPFYTEHENRQYEHVKLHFFDTPDRQFYVNNFIIYEEAPMPKGTPPQYEPYIITVKKISPRDPTPVLERQFFPWPSIMVIEEARKENIVAVDNQNIQSLFEFIISADTQHKLLDNRTLGDYASLFSGLQQKNMASDTPMIPLIIHSTRLNHGYFILPDGSQTVFKLEVWATSPDGPPVAVELSFDGQGYSGDQEHLKMLEDFFMDVVAKGLKEEYSMPDSDKYMGSKLQIIFDNADSKAPITNQ